MASIFTPTSFGAALGPYAIDINDCLGDSVGIINANTNYAVSYTAAVSGAANTQIINSANSVTTTLSTVPYARLNDGGQTGSAPIYGIRAWARWAGRTTDGTATISSSGNISNITRIDSGVYQVTFSIPMQDANYAVIVNSSGFTSRLDPTFVPTTNAFQVQFFSQAGAAINPVYCSVIVIR